MSFFRKLLNKKAAPYTIATCSAVVLYLALSNIDMFLGFLGGIYVIASPVIIGGIVAYVLSPIVDFVRNTLFCKIKKSPKIARNLSVLTTLVLVMALVALLMVALIPQLVSSVKTFQENFSQYATSFEHWIDEISNSKKGLGNLFKNSNQSWKENFSDALDNASKKMINEENVTNIIGTSYNVGKGFINFAIGCILAVYFLLDAPKILEVSKKLLRVCTTEQKYKDVTSFMRRCNRILVRFLMCDIIEGILVGAINFVFMAVFGMDYAVLISVVVGVTNLAPTFGPMVGCVIGGVVLVLVNPMWAAWFLVFTAILQTVDGYIIKPKLFGDTLGVSSLLILVAIVVGGRMFGVGGIILAIPFAAILDYIFKEIVWVRLEKWKEEREKRLLIEKKRAKKKAKQKKLKQAQSAQK